MDVATSDLERFFDLSYDMLCVLGYDGYYRRVNRAFEGTLGFMEQDPIAQPFVDFVHTDDRAASAADLELRTARADGPRRGAAWQPHGRQPPAGGTSLRAEIPIDIL
jgi:PAS domain S-box-containing protein